jgi:hypothetical protein
VIERLPDIENDPAYPRGLLTQTVAGKNFI